MTAFLSTRPRLRHFNPAYMLPLVWREVRRYFLRMRIRRLVAGRSDLFLHVGCGEVRFDGYINIDVATGPAVDLVMNIDDFDLFPSGCATRIESYHVFEHFTFSQACTALQQWSRILGPGGCLVLELPNFQVCIDEIGKHHNDRGIDLAMVGIYGYPPEVEALGFPLAHKWGWTPELLTSRLLAAGFAKVQEHPVKQDFREAARFGRDMNLQAVKQEYSPQFRHHILYSPSHRFLFCPIPKVACTSFKFLMLQLDGHDHEGKIDREFHELIGNRYGLARLKAREQSRILYDDDYLKFVIVRNPWDRLVSAYVDKFVRARRKEDFAAELMAAVNREKTAGPDAPISFREFVSHVVESAPAELDTHWRPQHYFMGDVQYDLILKMEDIDTGFSRLKKKLGLPAELALPEKNRVKQRIQPAAIDPAEFSAPVYDLDAQQLSEVASLPGYMDWYDGEMREKVEVYYREDIERFQYRFDG